MEFYVQGDPFDQPGYDEREFEGYKIAAQPGRNIRISHPQHGALEIVAGCVGSLIELLQWAQEIQWQESDDDC